MDGFYQRITGLDFIRGRQMYGLERITGSFRFPTGYSAWLLIVTLPFISLALFLKENPKIKKISSVLAVLLVLNIFMAYSRGALIAFVAALAILLFLSGSPRQRIISCIILILGLAVVMFILPENIKGRPEFSNIFTHWSSQHRIKMWTSAWRMFLDRPFIGQGLNTFMANFPRFRIPQDEAIGLWYAHNCFLQIAAEIGIFGLAAFLWMIVRMFVTSVRSWILIKDEFLKYLYLGLFCSIAGFLMHSAVETSLFSLRLAVLFYFSLGLLMAIKKVGLKNGKI